MTRRPRRLTSRSRRLRESLSLIEQPSVRRGSCGVVDAQYLSTAPIDGCEAFEDIIHLLNPEGEPILSVARVARRS